MSRSINISLIVAAFFFIAFCFFVVFEKGVETITGMAITGTLNIDSVKINQAITDETSTIALGSGDSISINDEFNLSLKSDTVKSFEIKRASEIIKEGAINGNYGTGTYHLNLTKFNLKYNAPGAYSLELSLKKNNLWAIITTKQIVIEDITLPAISSVSLEAYNETNGVWSSAYFMKGDGLACFASFSGIIIDINASIYGPKDSRKSPTYLLKKEDFKYYDEETSKIEACQFDGETNCFGYYEDTNIEQFGGWACTVFIRNEKGIVEKSSNFSLKMIPLIAAPEQALEGGESICDDGADNDNDGLADCEDSDCASSAACTGEICNDGIDNDNDTLFDCEDEQCAETEICLSLEICDNFIDDDGDGLIDCNDEGCVQDEVCLDYSGYAEEEIGGGLTTDETIPGEEAPQMFEVEPEKKTSPFLLFGLIFLLIVGLATGGVFLYERRQKKPELKKMQEVQAVQQQEIKEQPVNFNALRSYIENVLKQGGNINLAKQKLAEAGWNKDDVEREANFIMVKEYATRMMGKGLSKEQIKKTLLEKGWKEELLNEVFNSL